MVYLGMSHETQKLDPEIHVSKDWIFPLQINMWLQIYGLPLWTQSNVQVQNVFATLNEVAKSNRTSSGKCLQNTKKCLILHI